MPPPAYQASHLCSVWPFTPIFSATAVTDRPSWRTANTAWYRCSATLISLNTWPTPSALWRAEGEGG